MVRDLLKILGGGLVLFLVLAIADEWSFFSAAWFGGDEPASIELPEADRKAAADTVHLTLTLMGHLYQTGGDPRFADRMPASDGLKEEMLADITYLGHRHLLQNSDLRRLEVAGVEALSEDRLEVSTREWWRFTVTRADGSRVEPPQAQFVEAVYLVVRGGAGWQMESWRLAQPEESGEEGAG